MTVEAATANLAQVTEFIDGLLEQSDCPMKIQMKIDIAIDEIFGNIANYAYADAAGTVTVNAGYNADEAQFEITFIDSGMPYNPLEKDDPDVTLSAEERGIGGLGIFIVKNTMDDIIYRYEDGCNILTLIKKY